MSIIKHVTLQKIVAHDFRYDPRKYCGLLTTPETLRVVHCHRAYSGRIPVRPSEK